MVMLISVSKRARPRSARGHLYCKAERTLALSVGWRTVKRCCFASLRGKRKDGQSKRLLWCRLATGFASAAAFKDSAAQTRIDPSGPAR
jgi:hypothetical protein